jgi:hypothetical protein
MTPLTTLPVDTAGLTDLRQQFDSLVRGATVPNNEIGQLPGSQPQPRKSGTLHLNDSRKNPVARAPA